MRPIRVSLCTLLVAERGGFLAAAGDQPCNAPGGKPAPLAGAGINIDVPLHLVRNFFIFPPVRGTQNVPRTRSPEVVGKAHERVELSLRQRSSMHVPSNGTLCFMGA